MFLALNATRNVGMQASAITYSEISAYCALNKTTLSIFELNAIQLLDSIALTDPAKIKKGSNGD